VVNRSRTRRAHGAITVIWKRGRAVARRRRWHIVSDGGIDWSSGADEGRQRTNSTTFYLFIFLFSVSLYSSARWHSSNSLLLSILYINLYIIMFFNNKKKNARVYPRREQRKTLFSLFVSFFIPARLMTTYVFYYFWRRYQNNLRQRKGTTPPIVNIVLIWWLQRLSDCRN